MRGFIYDLFFDLSRIFGDSAHNPVAAPKVKVPKPVVEKNFGVEGLHAQLPASRFIDLNALRPLMKSRFLPLAPRTPEPVVTVAIAAQPPVAPIQIEETRTLAQSRFFVPAQKTDVAPKRKTLSLKTKVEVPGIGGISRRSSMTDLAALFKAEMKQITEMPAAQEEPQAQKLRRSFSSHKSWSELVAEAQKSETRRISGPDLARAFRSEMQAMLAEQKKAEERMPAHIAAQPARHAAQRPGRAA